MIVERQRNVDMASASVARVRVRTSADNTDQPVVIVVDDDDLMRSALHRLFQSAGLAAELYASGPEFLAQARPDQPSCVVLDVGMPGMNGLEVQARLKQLGMEIPVIFLTGASDIPIAVAAMREGAVDFVEKPFDNDDLLARVRLAIDHHRNRRQDSTGEREVLRRLNALTARERAVLELLVSGQTNKEIARNLGSSHRTIEVHRRHIMEKMAASSLADLVRMRLGKL
jgi:FixJ family two-component response regulator